MVRFKGFNSPFFLVFFGTPLKVQVGDGFKDFFILITWWNLVKWSNLTIIFSKWVVQPPARNVDGCNTCGLCKWMYVWQVNVLVPAWRNSFWKAPFLFGLVNSRWLPKDFFLSDLWTTSWGGCFQSILHDNYPNTTSNPVRSLQRSSTWQPQPAFAFGKHGTAALFWMADIAPQNMASQKERIPFQPSFFRLVSGRVHLFASLLAVPRCTSLQALSPCTTGRQSMT